MFSRKIELYLDSLADKYRLITLLGPRQSGKTTLARHYFKGYDYVSFEDPDVRSGAEQDPRGFMTKVFNQKSGMEITFRPMSKKMFAT